MSTELQRRYEKLLVAYPQPYKSERGPEIVATLMDASRDGQQWPTFREARELLVNGLRTQAWVACGNNTQRLWLGGVWIYALYAAVAHTIDRGKHAYWNFGGSVSIGILNDIYVTALPFVCLASVVFLLRGEANRALSASAVAAGIHLLDNGLRFPGNFPVSLTTLFLVLVPVAAIQYLRLNSNDALQPRSYWWLAIAVLPLITEFVTPRFVQSPISGFVVYAITFVVVPMAIILLARNIDPRILIAMMLYVVVFATAQLVTFMEFQFVMVSQPLELIWPYLFVIAFQLALAVVTTTIASRKLRQLALTI